jgi:rhamnosyltransferase
MTGVLDSSASVAPSTGFPDGGRRLVVYVLFDRRGEVDDYITVALAGLREHSVRVLVVVNGSLSEAGRAMLEPLADEILVRKNVGFDIWAHKDALDHIGASIADFDEVVLTNDTWFGPIQPFGPVLARMSDREVHFWGLTDHAREEPNPFTGVGVLPYHLQSFWIAVRREMFLSEAWEAYWRDLPAMPSYFDAVLKHEAIFTEHFTERGYSVDVAFPSAAYPTDHPALFNPDLLLDDGCPVVKRRPFFHYPPFLDRHAVIGRRILRHIAGFGFPMGVIWQNLARNVAPRILNADAGMLEVLPDVDVSYDPERAFRTVVVAHVTRVDALPSIVDRIAHVPSPYDVVLTADAALADLLRDALRHGQPHGAAEVQVREVVDDGGSDMTAFLVACSDVLHDPRYDIVVKVHTRLPEGRTVNERRYFERWELDNLLGTPGFVRNALALFQREGGLGMVFPPTIHVGYGNMGGAWEGLREAAVWVNDRMAVNVPMDGASPLAPLGGMFIARPDALRLMVEHDWKLSGSPHSMPPVDVARLQERLFVGAAGERGYHVRTILNAEHAGISHNSLEYKIDQLASTTPGYPVEQIQFLHSMGNVHRGRAVDYALMYLRRNRPRTVRLLRPVGRVIAGVRRRVRVVVGRVGKTGSHR